MKIKKKYLAGCPALIGGATVVLCTLNAQADLPVLVASNTNNVEWANSGGTSVIFAEYNGTGDLYDALDLSLTVASGSTLNFQSLDLYLGYQGGGSGGEPSPYLKIIDGSGNVLATTTPMTLTTPVGGMPDASGQSQFAPYLTDFSPASTVALNPGTYTLSIFDTGEQLAFPIGGTASGSGVSVTLSAPYGNPLLTPALLLYGASPVPEPATWAMTGMGALGLLRLRRKK